MGKPIISLDFDGVINSYTSGWQGARNIPDPPVPGALQFIVTALDKFEVHIFSSRSNHPGGREAMKKWLMKHFREIAPCSTATPEWWRAFIVNGPFEGAWANMVDAAARVVVNEIFWPIEKPPAFVSIDDRAIQFNGVWPSLEEIAAFKPWYKREPACKRCQDERWVCENHEDRPWTKSKPGGCTCGAGAPCPDCNPCDRDNPPAPAPGSKVIFDRDGYRH